MTTDKLSKTWSFTLNNYTPQEEQHLKDLECNLIVFGHEIGEDKSTPHLQGHIVFKQGYTLGGMKKNINARAHYKPAISEEHSINYCMKEDPDYFLKDNRKQGKRTDLEAVVHSLKESGLKKTIEDYPKEYIKYHNGIEKLNALSATERHFKPYVEWIYGSTGTGKTRSVVEKEKDLWISGRDLRWWNGYENQEATLFDDFRGDFCTFHELLRILDRYPYTVEVKGGSRRLNSKRMYITAPCPPEEMYLTIEDKSQLLRRIDKIVKL